VQVALVARWKGYAPLVALVGAKVYDGAAPDGAAPPYIVVGEMTEAPRRSFARAGHEDTITAHVWSAYNGGKEALGIMAQMNAALETPLTVAGFGTARLKPEFATTLVDRTGDAPLRHLPVRYRIRTRAAA
jgi:hypothetical protein